MANSSYKISDRSKSFWDETFDFKGSGKGRYTALKMDYTPISDPIIYSKVLDKIMEEEWSNMQQELQEGLRDWVMSKWRSGKEAISNMVHQVKKLYQKYVKEVITKFLQTIKDAAGDLGGDINYLNDRLNDFEERITAMENQLAFVIKELQEWQKQEK